MSGYLSARSFLLVCSLAVCLYSLSNHFFGENPVKNVHRRRGTQTAPSVAESGFFWDRAREQLNLPAVPLVSRKTEGIMAAKWVQKTVVLPAKSRGCHLVTDQILKDLSGDLKQFQTGLANLFLQHTSASLSINENYDEDVRHDTETFLNAVVPEGKKAPWRHTIEGHDDMPAHIKSSMFGVSLNIPITDGHLNLGTWQGIWLCEHQDRASSRKIVVTMQGV